MKKIETLKKLKIGLHYHIPVLLKNDKIYTSAFFGVFVDSIAKNCDEIIFYAYTACESEKKNMDYLVQKRNVKIYNLGILKRFSFIKIKFNNKQKKQIIKSFNQLDLIILRAPTALSFLFKKTPTPISILLVGDFPSSEQLNSLSLLSNIYNRILYRWMGKNQNHIIKKSIVFANNEILYSKNIHKAKKIFKIKTSTINKKDFYDKRDTCQNKIIKLIFVGRLEESKGLFELYKALSELKKLNYTIHLTIVGWKSKFINQLNKYADKFNIKDSISILGYVKLGKDLFNLYREHDIFVLPTKFDAFPRSITEAMSQSLPVITTTVGGIPKRLTNKKNALLISPANSKQLTEAIVEVITNKKLRKLLIKEGKKIAEECTLDVQSEIMFNRIHETYLD